MAFFTSRSDLNVGIVNEYILNSGGIIQGQGQEVIDFFDPTGGLPVNPSDGDRYISQATANGWINNYIEIYDEALDTWKNIEPLGGTFTWLTDIAPPQMRVWNPTLVVWEIPATGGGSVVAVPSTNDAIVRFNGAAGQVQNSGVILDDFNNITGVNSATMDGNLTVGGTISSVIAGNLAVTDRFINLNTGNTSVVGEATGLTMNYLATGIATTSILPGFTPAVPAVSDATIQTLAGGPLWVVGDVIQVSGSDNNDGLYEVQSHAANVLTIKSVGLNPPTLDFVKDQLITEALVGADITGVNVTVLQTGTTGVLEYATGNTAGDFTFSPIGGSNTQSFTAVGTTVNDVPSGVTTVRITMSAAGGGGGSAVNNGGGGGGSGQSIVGFTRTVTPGAALMTVTVGAGGVSDGVGGNSIVTYTGANPFTITAYGGGAGGTDVAVPGGGGGGGGSSSVGLQGIPNSTGNGGNISVSYPIIGPAGGFGGDDEVTAGIAQPGNQGQQSGYSIGGSGGGGAGAAGGANGGANIGGLGGVALNRGGGGAAGLNGPGADGAPNVLGAPGSSAAANSGSGGGGGSDNGNGGNGGSGFIVLEYF